VSIMTKDKFLKELNHELAVLTKDERVDILNDYKEHFELGLEAGKTEEEVAQSLGAPAQIARELLAGYHVNQKSEKNTGENILRTVLMVLMLGFFNLVFVIWIPIAGAALIFSGWLMAVVLMASPLLVIGNAIVHSGVFAWFDLFVSLAMCAGGYFVGLVMWYVTKWSLKITIWYVKFNVKLIKGA
jgi:uncharacterized membrane protein